MECISVGDAMEETWKPVFGFEGFYEVSNKGNIRSLDRTVTRNDGVVVAFKSKQLRPQKNSDGYLQIQISKGNKCKTLKIHRLVAEMFIPNPNGYAEVNHKDEDKTNNAVTNLEWCSHEQNSRYGTRGKRIASKLGKPLIAFVPGEDTPAFKFKSMEEAATQLGVSSESVRQALLYGWKCRGYILKSETKG
jgi:hypothetical protein